MARLLFALRMMRARFDSARSACPYCQSRAYSFIERKKMLIEARECCDCGLIYRWPIDQKRDNRLFYENAYEKIEKNISAPPKDLLQQLIQQRFKNSPWDKTHRVEFIKRLAERGGRLLDFGCSWGYGAYQYADLGFEVMGFEIDRKRAALGRSKLKVEIYSGWSEIPNSICFDVILADHSLEHLHNLRQALEEFRRHSKTGAKLVIFVPNGTRSQAGSPGAKWKQLIGETHTAAFTIDWFSKNLPRHGFHPEFFANSGEPLRDREDAQNQDEIALAATRKGP